MCEILLVYSGGTHDGMSRGVLATAELLSDRYSVTVLSTRYSSHNCSISRKINFIDGSRLSKYSLLRLIKKISKFESNLNVISFGFFSDFLVSLTCKYSKRISYVRSNLYGNYKYDCGMLYGFIKYRVHFFILCRFNLVMTLFNDSALKSLNVVTVPNFLGNDFTRTCRKKNDSTVNFPIKFIFVGSLSARKGVVSLLTAFHNASSYIGSKIELYLAGKGELEQDVQNFIKANRSQNIKLLGFVEDYRELYWPFDFCISASYSEGVSRSCMESLYCNVPVICRAIDGNAELVEDGVNGYLFDSDAQLEEILLNLAYSKLEPITRSEGSTLLPGRFSREEVGKVLFSVIDGHFNKM